MSLRAVSQEDGNGRGGYDNNFRNSQQQGAPVCPGGRYPGQNGTSRRNQPLQRQASAGSLPADHHFHHQFNHFANSYQQSMNNQNAALPGGYHPTGPGSLHYAGMGPMCGGVPPTSSGLLVTNSILFCRLLTFKDRCNQVRFFQVRFQKTNSQHLR